MWSVSTKTSRCVEVHEIWNKGTVEITRVEGFRTGSWTVETKNDKPPKFKLTQLPFGDEKADSINLFDNEYEVNEDEIYDGLYITWHFPEGFDPAEAESIEEGWEEDSYAFMEDNGWFVDETQYWTWSKLKIEKIE